MRLVDELLLDELLLEEMREDEEEEHTQKPKLTIATSATSSFSTTCSKLVSFVNVIIVLFQI